MALDELVDEVLGVLLVLALVGVAVWCLCFDTVRHSAPPTPSPAEKRLDPD